MSSLTMKLITLVLVLLTSFAPAKAQLSSQAIQALEAMPKCGLACMQTYVPQSSCALTDQHCLCTNEALTANITICVKANCSFRDMLTVTDSVSQLCEWPVRDRRHIIRGVTIPFFVVATLFYFARMTARMPYFGGEFGPDDYTISVAWLFTLGTAVCQLLLARYGIGTDLWTVPHSHSDDWLTAGLEVTLAYEECYAIATWIAKISVLLLYLRIFQGNTKFRVRVNLAIAFCAVTLIGIFWLNIFRCRPVSYNWTWWDGEHVGSCVDASKPIWASAALNIFGDLLVVFLPLPIIWKMTLSKSSRLGVMIMFSAGIIITIVSAARLSTLHVFDESENQTMDFVNAILYTVVEVDITIMCACLPGTRNFYNRVICGRLIGKGRFAAKPSRSNSSASGQRQMIETSHSATSNISKAATLGRTEEVIIVIKDFDVEARAVSPVSQNGSWSNASYVEEWPIQTPQPAHLER